MDRANTPPTISVGLAVRNDPHRVRRCIESVLAQDFTDLELVICDNASDDETVETLEDYARQDPRVTVAVNPINIGSHENMNRVLELSCGTLFRWISADDWLEPGALSAGVRALERRPDAVGVTSGFTIHTPGVAPRHERYQGEFPTSPDPARRFERMLWFFHAGDAKYDPVYGIYRREKLMRSGRVRPNERTDWLLSAELALLAPILHIDDLLAHRTSTYPVGIDRAAFRRRLDPVQGERLKTSPARLSRDLYALARSANLTDAQLRCCRRAVGRFWAREVVRCSRMRLSDTIHREFPELAAHLLDLRALVRAHSGGSRRSTLER
jgi:glycosyltransferase involved in cell wall biosynthesis